MLWASRWEMFFECLFNMMHPTPNQDSYVSVSYLASCFGYTICPIYVEIVMLHKQAFLARKP